MQNQNIAAAFRNGRFESELQDVFPDGVRTKEAQVEYLKRLVPVWAIQRDSKVANGKPWVPHEYVVHLLDLVFGAITLVIRDRRDHAQSFAQRRNAGVCAGPTDRHVC